MSITSGPSVPRYIGNSIFVLLSMVSSAVLPVGMGVWIADGGVALFTILGALPDARLVAGFAESFFTDVFLAMGFPFVVRGIETVVP